MGTKVDLEIKDEQGAVIRGWEEDVHRGLNRITWNLRRDAFRRPETEPTAGGDSEERPSGIRVMPGTYTLTVSFGDDQRSSTFAVLPDPREGATSRDRLAKYEVLLEAGALRESIADAISLVYRIRADLDAALAAADRADPKTDEAGSEDPATVDSSLEDMAQDIRKRLTEIEEMLWVPEGTKGIVYSDDRAWNRLGYVMGSMQSSWDAPTPAQLAYLREAEQVAASVLLDLDSLYNEQVDSFRAAVREAGLGLVPEEDPPRVP
ncbi:MAG: hypothetical protein HKP01_12060 [Gemmatimonadetes bacterium]|nr:hypothetical protein [Gemmatimonadota bacterium]